MSDYSRRSMKVFSTDQYFNKDHQQCRAVVACLTQKKAAEIFDMPYKRFRMYSSITGNQEDKRLAKAKPETVIIREVY